MSIFLLLGRILPASTGLPPNGRFGGIGRALSIYGRGNKQYERSGNVFFKMGDTRGIILGEIILLDTVL